MTDNTSTDNPSSESSEASGAGNAAYGAAMGNVFSTGFTTHLRNCFPVSDGALRLFGVLLVAGGLAACGSSENRSRQSDEPVDTAAVKSALDSLRRTFITAYEAGDAEKIASLWAEQGRQAIPMAPPVRGRDTIEALSRRWFESNPATRDATVDTVRDVRVLSEDWAYAYTTWTFRVTPEGHDETQTTTATFVMLYRQTPDGWKTYLEVGSAHSAPGG